MGGVVCATPPWGKPKTHQTLRFDAPPGGGGGSCSSGLEEPRGGSKPKQSTLCLRIGMRSIGLSYTRGKARVQLTAFALAFGLAGALGFAMAFGLLTPGGGRT